MFRDLLALLPQVSERIFTRISKEAAGAFAQSDEIFRRVVSPEITRSVLGGGRSNGTSSLPIPNSPQRASLIYPLPPQNGSAATDDGKFACLRPEWLITRKCAESMGGNEKKNEIG